MLGHTRKHNKDGINNMASRRVRKWAYDYGPAESVIIIIVVVTVVVITIVTIIIVIVIRVHLGVNVLKLNWLAVIALSTRYISELVVVSAWVDFWVVACISTWLCLKASSKSWT